MSLADLFATALAHHEAGRTDAAEAGYRTILHHQPDHPHANNNLAILLRATGRLDEVTECYRRAVAALPGDATIRNNFACALAGQDRPDDALAAVRVAIALHPGNPDAWFNAGNIANAADDPAAARTAYRRALHLRPDMGEAHSNLADVLRTSGALSRAAEHYRMAIRLSPDLPHPYVNLAETLKEQGFVTEAIAILQEGRNRHPDLALLHSNLLLALHYSPWVPPEVIARAHAHWNDRHARPLSDPRKRHANSREPDRRLRVGYVSSDFCGHACAHFILPLLRGHDREGWEVVCYHTVRRQDAVTERMRALADGWRSLADPDDAAAAALVEADGIDILVDLGGHTADSRPLLFARRPAPVQVSWLGYPDTTGMPAMDYRLTDAIADPEGRTDRWHAETLVRLPHGFLAFQPLADAGSPAPAPLSKNGFVTFGSFNNAAKVTPEVAAVWSAILNRVPASRLLLKAAAFADDRTRAHWLERFARHGVPPERVALLPPVAGAARHLRLYDQVDVALDPFPYNGTTTSCEALWMGVPVVTLAGTHHVARVGASLLTRCGLEDLVASDAAGYVAAAVGLAEDPARLAALRAGMRARLEASPLTDHRGFTRSVEAAFRTMWRSWATGA